MKLHDRINRVINTAAFEESLSKSGMELFDFQCEWPKYSQFDDLPEAYRKAIEAGESELFRTGELTLV